MRTPEHPRFALVLVAFAVLLAATIACDASIEATPSPETDGIEGVTWRLQLPDPRPGSAPSARFIDGTLSGNGGCNGYSASYRLEDGIVEIGNLSMTLMACYNPDGSHRRDYAPGSGAHRIELRGEAPNRTLLLHGPQSTREYREAPAAQSTQ